MEKFSRANIGRVVTDAEILAAVKEARHRNPHLDPIGDAEKLQDVAVNILRIGAGKM
jgi:hypothetical protein